MFVSLPPPGLLAVLGAENEELHLERQRQSQGGEPEQILLMEGREAEASNRSIVRSVMSLQIFHSLSIWKDSVLAVSLRQSRVVLRKELCQWALGISVLCPC